MTALNDRFWAKVLFSQFIKHYRKMNDEQIVADIKQSMDDLEDLIDEGDSFGAKMVRWSMERVDQYPQARENGKKGGRPRKQETTADGDIREDSLNVTDGSNAAGLESRTSAKTLYEARQNQREGEGSLRLGGHVTPSRTCRPPRDFEEVKDFIAQNGLDYDDARLWWERNYVERDGIDKDGKPIKNWKGALVNACKAEETKRRTA